MILAIFYICVLSFAIWYYNPHVWFRELERNTYGRILTIDYNAIPKGWTIDEWIQATRRWMVPMKCNYLIAFDSVNSDEDISLSVEMSDDGKWIPKKYGKVTFE